MGLKGFVQKDSVNGRRRVRMHRTELQCRAEIKESIAMVVTFHHVYRHVFGLANLTHFTGQTKTLKTVKKNIILQILLFFELIIIIIIINI